MPAYEGQIGGADLDDLVAYLAGLKGKPYERGWHCCCCARRGRQVPYDRIVNAAKEPGNWLTYSGNYQGHRYSPLTEITAANVADCT